MSSRAWERSNPALAVALFVAVALVLASIALQPGQADARGKSCGTYSSSSIYPKGKVKALQGVSCRVARKVAEKYDHRGNSSKGYSCFLGHGGRTLFSCGKGGSSGDVRKFPHAFTVAGVGKPS